jgi:hypothetical protein
MKSRLWTVLWLAAASLRPTPASAQVLPSQPIVLADGRVTLGGDVAATFGSYDGGYFNYADYEHSQLRVLRMDLAASVRANDHVTVLGEVRSENVDTLQAYALYVRLRPWTTRAIDINIGRVPPTFGAFTRRIYAADNPLIGYPLAYQYLTALRADAVPAHANELLAMRGRGWLTYYSLGNPTPDRGLPLASGSRWDTGIQLHAAAKAIEGTFAVTAGTLSHPLVKDDNTGRQMAGRVSLRPAVGLVLGASASRGPFLSDRAARGAVGDGRTGEFTQTAWGADVEYSRDYYLVRAETVFSRYVLPSVQTPVIDEPLTAMATYLEGRYKLRPGLYTAARMDWLRFSEITGSAGRTTWEAPVTRIEVGGGYAIQRNLLLKVAYQHNVRDGGRVTTLDAVAAQLVFWF